MSLLLKAFAFFSARVLSILATRKLIKKASNGSFGEIKFYWVIHLKRKSRIRKHLAGKGMLRHSKC